MAMGLPAWAWSLLALLLGVSVAVWLTTVQQRRATAERSAALETIYNNTYAGLVERLESCELLTRAVQTLFLTSDVVTDTEFGNLYANLEPRERLSSLQALAYAPAREMADGTHFITTLVAPRTGNESVLGLDVNAQPTNLAGVLRSRDSDEPALSAPFRLVQMDAGSPIDGLTLRLPVYTPGPPPLSVQERRARFRGTLASSFRASSLIESALSADVLQGMHIQVTDVTGGDSLHLYDSHPRPHGEVPASDPVERDLSYGGRVWRLSMHPVTHAAATYDWAQSVLWPGLFASLLLALLVGSVATTRRRALELGWRMSHRYRESEERFRALNDLLPALVLLARIEDGRITYANQASRDRLGDAICTSALADVFDDMDAGALTSDDSPANFSNVEAMLRGEGGAHFWASVSIARVVLDGHDKLLMVASDISQQRELTELLSYQASHDALTELYNRREFERRLERALVGLAAGGPPAALLYIDLDQFKLINDTSGHIAGDQLLTQLAMMMRGYLRDGDVLARLGGDEFGVLAANVHDLAGARLVAERLREHIDGYVFVWEQRNYTVSASIGGVMLEKPDNTLKDLLAQADTACYIAKETGRNRVHFYSAEDDETARRNSEMEWAHRLRWAVSERRLVLNYQEVWPLTQEEAGDGPSIELLLRFRDENGRLVAPGAFIPAAERYGLMPMIDRWVIETALAHFDQLHPAGSALKLAAINLSGASIEDDSLADLILQLLEQHAIAPERVCFEITETVAVRNLLQVTRFIERLRGVGCQIALDDFGAGMSSFGYLKNLPVDIIKIDGSFIRDLLTDPMSHSIVRAVNDIGHQRGMLVVAEWVSSEEITAELIKIGVDFAQGFALHRPELVAFHKQPAVSP